MSSTSVSTSDGLHVGTRAAGERSCPALDGRTLETRVFPELARQLRETGEVYVDYNYASHFAHYLMREWVELWWVTEQEPTMTDDFKAHFVAGVKGARRR